MKPDDTQKGAEGELCAIPNVTPAGAVVGIVLWAAFLAVGVVQDNLPPLPTTTAAPAAVAATARVR